MPHYELDETKRQETLDRRELDFADIETGFERDTATIAPSGYPGEARLVAYEYFRTRLPCCRIHSPHRRYAYRQFATR